MLDLSLRSLRLCVLCVKYFSRQILTQRTQRRRDRREKAQDFWVYIVRLGVARSVAPWHLANSLQFCVSIDSVLLLVVLNRDLRNGPSLDVPFGGALIAFRTTAICFYFLPDSVFCHSLVQPRTQISPHCYFTRSWLLVGFKTCPSIVNKSLMWVNISPGV